VKLNNNEALSITFTKKMSKDQKHLNKIISKMNSKSMSNVKNIVDKIDLLNNDVNILKESYNEYVERVKIEDKR